jgi:hypothetical protein
MSSHLATYPDPLRQGKRQGCIWTDLCCAVCGRDLTNSKQGLVDIGTGKTYCGVEHYTARERRPDGA